MSNCITGEIEGCIVMLSHAGGWNNSFIGFGPDVIEITYSLRLKLSRLANILKRFGLSRDM